MCMFYIAVTFSLIQGVASLYCVMMFASFFLNKCETHVQNFLHFFENCLFIHFLSLLCSLAHVTKENCISEIVHSSQVGQYAVAQ